MSRRCSPCTHGWPARARSGRAVVLPLAIASLAALLGGCARSPEPYGVVRDAALAPDGTTLLVLVESGTSTVSSGNIWSGDTETRRPELLRVHAFDRRDGSPGPVVERPAPVPFPSDPVIDPGTAGAGASRLQNCLVPLSACAEAAAPRPFVAGGRVVDPGFGRTIAWDGRMLVVSVSAVMDAAAIRAARLERFRRSVERIRDAARQDLAARAARGEDVERLLTGDAGTAEGDPDLQAYYRLTPGRTIFARFTYGTRTVQAVWSADGSCATDGSEVAAALRGACRLVDEPRISRAVRGIASERPPDPARTGTSWGVVEGAAAMGSPADALTLGCHGTPPPADGRPCDLAAGNTLCATPLPLLCAGPGAAGPAIRRLASTEPVAGTRLTSAAAADGICRDALGDGWTMSGSSPSDGLYEASGTGRLPRGTRFWVRNGDGTANCW